VVEHLRVHRNTDIQGWTLERTRDFFVDVSATPCMHRIQWRTSLLLDSRPQIQIRVEMFLLLQTRAPLHQIRSVFFQRRVPHFQFRVAALRVTEVVLQRLKVFVQVQRLQQHRARFARMRSGVRGLHVRLHLFEVVVDESEVGFEFGVAFFVECEVAFDDLLEVHHVLHVVLCHL